MVIKVQCIFQEVNLNLWMLSNIRSSRITQHPKYVTRVPIIRIPYHVR